MNDRLSEIEGRLEAAALWPWEAAHYSPVTHEVIGPTPDDTGGVLIAADVSVEDAELIAHAPADLAALVAALKAMGDAHAEHRRVLTNDGARPERVDTCHCLGCVMYRVALDALDAS